VSAYAGRFGALDDLLGVLVSHGVATARLGSSLDTLTEVTFHPPAPPPLVVTPGEDDPSDRPPGPVDTAAMALASRGRKKSADE
jgi:hypothetical protein